VTPKTETLVSALRVLSVEIQSGDGVANAVVAEAADRLTLMANLVARHIEETKKDTQEMQTACETMNGATETIQRLKERIKLLEEELIDAKGQWAALVTDVVLYEDIGERIKRLEEAGDALLRDNDDMANINQWRKAKEAKP
jgi:archaellum component FlaC